MQSIAFPKMFNNMYTNTVADKEATKQNLKLLLLSERTSMLGDPYFGTNIKRFIHEQNNIILKDIIIDDIYVSIQDFMPQVYVKRSDIQLTLKNSEVYCTINCINKLSNQNNLYEVNLTESV